MLTTQCHARRVCISWIPNLNITTLTVQGIISFDVVSASWLIKDWHKLTDIRAAVVPGANSGTSKRISAIWTRRTSSRVTRDRIRQRHRRTRLVTRCSRCRILRSSSLANCKGVTDFVCLYYKLLTSFRAPKRTTFTTNIKIRTQVLTYVNGVKVSYFH